MVDDLSKELSTDFRVIITHFRFVAIRFDPEPAMFELLYVCTESVPREGPGRIVDFILLLITGHFILQRRFASGPLSGSRPCGTSQCTQRVLPPPIDVGHSNSWSAPSLTFG
ncbi:uncharacterized protein BO97DRAFT_41611 [Aspergillus homomorphus CBS 101889]|uniref:Uncharacterized protein n=1 Tax=Aspergillus homomorphus (strain CBS 101889) TaxID=1450537 RepID=A0A395I1L6_ASPHC|nr:hypothetical protein BO97DRAFT_41611 [Aspergillus homomorphus CBS 101889]RAL13523.1 hypothetical protein BO97DRAFT_41611 [Aspergillus homomorphus CBS 101889]